MFVCQRLHGRWVSEDDFALLQGLITAHPEWSRLKLSVDVAGLWNWRTATGQLRDMAVRNALNKLQERGLIELPARQKRGGQRSRRLLSEEQVPTAQPLLQTLASLQPLRFVLTEPGTRESALVFHYIQKHHYLGYGVAVGQKLEYLVRDSQGRDLACLVFSAAAWKVQCRDQFIGWSHGQRQKHLPRIVNNTRFLILPWVQVPNLASHILSAVARLIVPHWRAKYGLAPCLLESFVDTERFAGVCYRAANWLRAGQTKGRSRQDRYTSICVPIKDVYLRPLSPTFREELRA
jgi:hypothetical protein